MRLCQWQAAYRSTGAPLAGATVVAEWGQGRPLVVRGAKAGRRIAALNMYPVSATMGSILWVGDGAALMRNALLYSACVPCRIGAFAPAGDYDQGDGGGVVATAVVVMGAEVPLNRVADGIEPCIRLLLSTPKTPILPPFRAGMPQADIQKEEEESPPCACFRSLRPQGPPTVLPARRASLPTQSVRNLTK